MQTLRKLPIARPIKTLKTSPIVSAVYVTPFGKHSAHPRPQSTSHASHRETRPVAQRLSERLTAVPKGALGLSRVFRSFSQSPPQATCSDRSVEYDPASSGKGIAGDRP